MKFGSQQPEVSIGFYGLRMIYGVQPWLRKPLGIPWDSKIPWQTWQTFLASWKTKCGEENSLVSDSLWQLFWVHGKVHSLAAMNSSTSMSIPRIDQRKYLQINLLIHFHRKKQILFFFFLGVAWKTISSNCRGQSMALSVSKNGGIPRSYGRLKGDMMIMKFCFSKKVSGTQTHVCINIYIYTWMNEWMKKHIDK